MRTKKIKKSSRKVMAERNPFFPPRRNGGYFYNVGAKEEQGDFWARHFDSLERQGLSRMGNLIQNQGWIREKQRTDAK